MAIKSASLIYKILEEHLKMSRDTPLSCHDLWDFNDVRMNAKSVEKVSDYLGLMWRRNLLQRWTTPGTETSRARFAYKWKTNDTQPRSMPEAVSEPKPKLAAVITNYKKANVTITEDGNRLILDFDGFTMTIQSKA